MEEAFGLCCTKMQKAIQRKLVQLVTYPNTNTITFMTASLVLIYCPFCGQYLPETSELLTKI